MLRFIPVASIFEVVKIREAILSLRLVLNQVQIFVGLSQFLTHATTSSFVWKWAIPRSWASHSGISTFPSSFTTTFERGSQTSSQEFPTAAFTRIAFSVPRI